MKTKRKVALVSESISLGKRIPNWVIPEINKACEFWMQNGVQLPPLIIEWDTKGQFVGLDPVVYAKTFLIPGEVPRVCINAYRYRWPNQFVDLWVIIRHELGHVLGLLDSPDDPVMAPQQGQSRPLDAKWKRGRLI